MASSTPDMPFPPYLGDDPGILNFKYLSDESLKEAWDRLLKIQVSARPQFHIKLFLKSFYVGLPLAHRRVLDSIFENDFLGGDAFATYEKMKSIFGQPKVETIEPTTLEYFHQTEQIKETKASMDSNFQGIFNLAINHQGIDNPLFALGARICCFVCRCC